MPSAYLVRIRSASIVGHVETLQVVAESPEDAVAAAERVMEPGATIEAEPVPVPSELAAEFGLARNPRLN